MTEATAGRPAEVAVEVSVADWTAGYEAGYSAGYHAARTALDDAARALAALHPSQALDVADSRRGTRALDRSADGEPDFTDLEAVAAYRARIYASWGLTPPDTDAGATAPGTRTDEEPAS